MSQLEDLPPDQRAVLSLLLRQRKSYAEVAEMLDIEPRAVHDRAHAALAVLAPRQARELSPEQREQIGEYLLGQQSAAGRQQTRALLGDSDTARGWAQTLADELSALSSAPLPEIPQPGRRAKDKTRGPNRTGGAVLLGAIAVVVVVVVVLILSNGGGGSNPPKTTASAPSSATSKSSSGSSTSTGTSSTAKTGASTTAASKSEVKEDNRLTLSPTEPSSKATGVAEIISKKKQFGFYVIVGGLPAAPSGSFYGVWLSNSSTEFEPLGSLPALNSSGVTEGGDGLPANASRYRHMIITRETTKQPKQPGPTVLSGDFSLS